MSYQFPDNAQSFNGYGYCLNNPLKYSDPSGMLAMAGDFDNSMFDMSSYVTRNTPEFGLANLPWSFGGGSTGGGGDPFDAMNECLSDDHPNGGSWSSTSGLHYYENQAQAFVSGCLTNQLYGYWGCRPGAANSWGEAISNYTMSFKYVSLENHPSPEVAELASCLNSLKQYFAIVAGEAGPGEEEAAGIGSVILNICRYKGFSVFDINFISEIGGRAKFNAIGEPIYKAIMSSNWDNIFSLDNRFSSRIRGAGIALISGTDYSNGAYFFNANDQLLHPENYQNHIGGNWDAYYNGTFVITQFLGGTTFFRYNNPNKHWP